MAIANGAHRWYDSSDSDDDTPRKEDTTHAVKLEPSPLKRALRKDAFSDPRQQEQEQEQNVTAVETPDHHHTAEPRIRRSGRDDDGDDDDVNDDDDSSTSSLAPSPAAPGDTPSPYAHLSRLSRASGGHGANGYGHHASVGSSHALLPIPAWSPGLRGRTARNREVLLVARNAREQAKENEFLRARVRELEEEIAEGSERVQRVRSALEAGERAVEASADSVRQLESRLEGAKQREVALKAEAAAHAAAAEQLTLELERMRAIEEQTSLEAAALIQKTSRLQNELNASARQAAIAEEMLVGVQVEGYRALEASEHAMMELQRRLHELEADECNKEDGNDEAAGAGSGASSSDGGGKRGKRRGGGARAAAGTGGNVAGDLAALLDQAMGEAAALREAVASAASEAGRWRAEASRMEKEHGDTALERSYDAAVAELKALRDENAFLRSDLMALHSGIAAEEEAMSGGGGGGGGGEWGAGGVGGSGDAGGGSVGGDAPGLTGGGEGKNMGAGQGVSRQLEPGRSGGGGVGWGSGGGLTPAKKGGVGVGGRFSSPARSSFKKQLQRSESQS